MIGTCESVLLGKSFGILFALAFGIGTFMTSAYGKYIAARFLLALGGRLPWRTMAFLDEAAKRGVLRQLGSVYQFRHTLLQERLAESGR
jgi:hypothetical protein